MKHWVIVLCGVQPIDIWAKGLALLLEKCGYAASNGRARPTLAAGAAGFSGQGRSLVLLQSGWGKPIASSPWSSWKGCETSLSSRREEPFSWEKIGKTLRLSAPGG